MVTVLAESSSYHHSMNLSPPDPNGINLWMPSPSPDPTSYTNMSHLSPISPYQSGSSDNLVDIMGTPPHQSPHRAGFSETNDGCRGAFMYTGEFNTGCDMLPQYSTGERSPDSGIYSPTCHSPPTSEFDALQMTDPMPTSTLSSLSLDSSNKYLSNSILHYSQATTHHVPPPMFPPLGCPYPTTSNMTYSEMSCPPPFARNHPFVDSPMDPNAPIPITLHDQNTGSQLPPAGNPIQYYPEPDPLNAFLETHDGSPPCYPQFVEEFMRPQNPVKTQKRTRKVKPPASVDPSEIKDIPASAQLWEFLLKVLKKPKYAYMVSWENQQDGLFRFHDPPAFAALWGRHRNRPSMTYDKVARALRYYYRRDILEQVGGRLTYKFSPRLCKQFTSSSSSSTSNSTEKSSTSSSDKKN